jgi:predicted Fe-Mo cluster-binding NifX family protein
MIAFPVKTNKANPALSPLFGKSKYFAFYDGKTLNIEKNEQEGGCKVIQWLKDKEVDSIVLQEIGKRPYEKAKEFNMQLFYSGDERITTSDIIDIIDASRLQIITEEEIQQIIEKHDAKHSHTSH